MNRTASTERLKDQALVLRDLKRKLRGIENERGRLARELASAQRSVQEFTEAVDAGRRLIKKQVSNAWFVLGYGAFPEDPKPTRHMLRLSDFPETWREDIEQKRRDRANSVAAVAQPVASDPVTQAANIVRLDDYRDRADRKRQTREVLCGSTDADDDYVGPEVVDHLASARLLLIQVFESLGEPIPETLREDEAARPPRTPEGPEAA